MVPGQGRRHTYSISSVWSDTITQYAETFYDAIKIKSLHRLVCYKIAGHTKSTTLLYMFYPGMPDQGMNFLTKIL